MISFDIDITSMNNTFSGCTSLTNLYIQNMDFENKTVDTTNIFKNVPSGVNIYVKNAYNQNFIQGLKSNANVIIYIPPEEELEES